MANVIRLKKDEAITQLKSKLPAAQKDSNGIEVKKYSGKLALSEDPGDFQKRIRDEWNS